MELNKPHAHAHQSASQRYRSNLQSKIYNLKWYNSCGLNRRQKLLYLCRCIPLVETNVNMVELAPREPGKTYLYRNVSYCAHVLSGGKATLVQRLALHLRREAQRRGFRWKRLLGGDVAKSLPDSLEKTVILIVGADPEPGNSILFEQSEGSVSQANTHRIEWLTFFHPLEEKARMRRVITPQLVGLPRPLADFWGQGPVMLPE